MLDHPLLERINASLVDAVPSMSVVIHGQWSSCVRRSNQPDVVDRVWEARLTAAFAFTGIAFLRSASGVYWAKAGCCTPEVCARVSFHAEAAPADERATLAVGLADTRLPAIPVVTNFQDPSECLVDTAFVPTARVACLARCDDKAFYVILLAADSVKFGRNRLWRLRDSIVRQLPSDIGELLTRHRAGVLPPATSRE
jgi:hypothetical protein